MRVPVRAKSIYEGATPDDGIRVLATHYWPRGVSRERAGLYVRALAPTRELLDAFRNGEVSWSEYEARYLTLMREEEREQEIDRLARMSESDAVTVMCVCKDEAHCHRRLLRDLVADRARSVATST